MRAETLKDVARWSTGRILALHLHPKIEILYWLILLGGTGVAAVWFYLGWENSWVGIPVGILGWVCFAAVTWLLYKVACDRYRVQNAFFAGEIPATPAKLPWRERLAGFCARKGKWLKLARRKDRSVAVLGGVSAVGVSLMLAALAKDKPGCSTSAAAGAVVTAVIAAWLTSSELSPPTFGVAPPGTSPPELTGSPMMRTTTHMGLIQVGE